MIMDIRSSILKQATHLFADQGFDGTSVQQIADAVGLRKPSLLYHFGTKEELRQQVLAVMTTQWNEVLPQVVLKAPHEDRFDAMMGALCSFFMEDTDRARLLLREVMDRPNVMRGQVDDFAKPWIQMVADQLERAKAKGLVQQAVDTTAYAVQILTMIVSSIAVFDNLHLYIPDDSTHGNPRERHITELIRIVRTSLYIER